MILSHVPVFFLLLSFAWAIPDGHTLLGDGPWLPPPPPPAPPSAAVVGGEPASAEIAKRHAFLNIFHADAATFYVCGATMLTNWTLLSAAHCFFRPGDNSVTTGVAVFVGDLARESSFPFSAARLYVHKDYSVTTVNGVDVYQNDLAIIVLSSAVPSDRFVPMKIAQTSDDMPGNGTLIWASGFGQTSFGGSLSDVLKTVQLRKQLFYHCNIAEPSAFRPYLNRTVEICATAPGFPDVGGNDTCNGDSGGPLYWNRPSDGELVQVGITSWGSTGCAGAGTVAWYTKVRRYRNDIKNLFNSGGGNTIKWTVYPPPPTLPPSPTPFVMSSPVS